MVVRPLDLKKDSFQIVNMLKARGMDVNLIQDLPQFCLVAAVDSRIIALGGIRRVEGRRGMLDSYITLPSASSKDRHRALDTITSKLTKIAKNNNLRQLLAFSVHEEIRNRAENHGFIPFKSAYLQLINLTHAPFVH